MTRAPGAWVRLEAPFPLCPALELGDSKARLGLQTGASSSVLGFPQHGAGLQWECSEKDRGPKRPKRRPLATCRQRDLRYILLVTRGTEASPDSREGKLDATSR